MRMGSTIKSQYCKIKLALISELCFPLVPCQLCKLNSKEHKRKSDNKIVESYRVDLNGNNLLPELLHSAFILAEVIQRFLQISHLFIAAPPKKPRPSTQRTPLHAYVLFVLIWVWATHTHPAVFSEQPLIGGPVGPISVGSELHLPQNPSGSGQRTKGGGRHTYNNTLTQCNWLANL